MPPDHPTDPTPATPDGYGRMDDGRYWFVAETRDEVLEEAWAIDDPALLAISEEQVLMDWLPDDHFNRPGLMQDEWECPDDPGGDACSHVRPIWVWEVRYAD